MMNDYLLVVGLLGPIVALAGFAMYKALSK